MRMSREQARERFTDARVARLATVRPDAGPHLVPIVFAVDGDVIYTAVDHKPKRTSALRRLANIAHNPRVCVLVDHYEPDWDALWWARADGNASVAQAGSPQAAAALQCLANRYPQYLDRQPPGPVIAVQVTRWSGWLAAG